MSERTPRSALLFLIGGAVALGVGLAVLGEDPSPNRDEMLAYWRAEDPACTQGLKAEDVDVAVDLSAQWLLANQLSHGPFVDSRDWRTGEGDETVVPMRQAIALWALARYHHSQPDPAVGPGAPSVRASAKDRAPWCPGPAAGWPRRRPANLLPVCR